MYFLGHDVSYELTLFSSALYALTGFFNLILFSITRPALSSDPPRVEMDATPLPPIPTSRRHYPEQESPNPVYLEIIDASQMDPLLVQIWTTAN
jgi:hypothetical protein